MIKQILIVDDDITICNLLIKLFQNHSYNAIYALSADEALRIINYIKIDAMVVDFMMPQVNGLDLLAEVKKRNFYIPSIMLTAVNEVEHKLIALSNLTDDYLTKPFISEELILRVANLLKRASKGVDNTQSDLIRIRDLIFNRTTKELSINNSVLHLSATEENILYILTQNINIILYKEDILQYAGKQITINNLNALNVAIMRLRKKLDSHSTDKKPYIKTIRGKGLILLG